MGKRIALAVVSAVCMLGSTAYAVYTVTNAGTWPKSWPAELEPLRKQSRTLEGPEVLDLHYAIRFATKEQFEAAWPHIVKLKRQGAPLHLKRGPNFFLGRGNVAGVVVHCPPRDEADARDNRKARPAGETGGGNAYSLELVVDGQIVDLNRISLPADTPVVDERFK
jgi:hypothetical protein